MSKSNRNRGIGTNGPPLDGASPAPPSKAADSPRRETASSLIRDLLKTYRGIGVSVPLAEARTKAQTASAISRLAEFRKEYGEELCESEGD